MAPYAAPGLSSGYRSAFNDKLFSLNGLPTACRPEDPFSYLSPSIEIASNLDERSSGSLPYPYLGV